MVELELAVDVDATPEDTFAALIDWDRQGEWMLGTRVRGTVHGGRHVGGGIEAFTGMGRLGFLDTMVITAWDPPLRCDVRHTGRVVKGSGSFVVEPRAGGHSRFIWREELLLPWGRVGRVAWWLGRPLAAAGVGLSLRRFAAWVPKR